MAIIRHKQRAITSLTPAPGQGRWINPNKGLNSPSSGGGPYSMQMVRWNGAGSSLLRTGAFTALADDDPYTLSLFVLAEDVTAIGEIWDSFAAARVLDLRWLNPTGEALSRFFDSTSTNIAQQGPTAASDISAGRHHIVIRGEKGGNIEFYLDDMVTPIFTGAAWIAQTVNWNTTASWGIGSQTNANNPIIGMLGDVWFNNTFEDPAQFGTGTTDPGDNGELYTGSQPQVFFGGSMFAADWLNTSTNNHGTGGPYQTATNLTDAGPGLFTQGIAVGDSIMTVWPDFQVPSATIVNSAISGAKLADCITQLTAAIAANPGAEFVCLQGGINDVLQTPGGQEAVNLAQMKGDWQTMMDAAQAANLSVFALNITPFTGAGDAAKVTMANDFNAWLVSDQVPQGARLVDQHTLLEDAVDTLDKLFGRTINDFIHPGSGVVGLPGENRWTSPVVTISSVGTVATVTDNGHPLVNGDEIVMNSAVEAEFNVKPSSIISNVTLNTFDYTIADNGSNPATGSPQYYFFPSGKGKQGDNLNAILVALQ